MGRPDNDNIPALGFDPGPCQLERSEQHNGQGQHIQFGAATKPEEAECSTSSFDEGVSTSDGDLSSPDISSQRPYYDQQDRARSVLGISISQVQTHLASPTTPATEKTAALQASDGYFGPIQGTLHGLSLASKDVSPTGSELSLNASNESALQESLISGDGNEISAVLPKRARARSDPDPSRMSLPIELPLLSQVIWQHPQRGEITHRVANNSVQSQLHDKRPNVDPIPLNDIPEQTNANLSSPSWQKPESQLHPTHHSPDNPLSSNSVDADRQTRLYADINASRRPSLATRRATSDDSVTFHRALSRASSFGDDTRFEHVREQVNNRLKALKDSFYDSNFRLPSLPSLPKVPKVPNFFSYPKAGSFVQSASNLPSQQPPVNIKSDAAITGMTASGAASHPFFAQALDELEGDLVLLGGYRGSVLRSAEAPHRQLWVPLKVGLNLRKVDLEVGLEDEDEERMTETIIPDGMLKHIGPVDISRRLLKRLRATENSRSGKLRIHDYGYDWRLSPHKLSRDFIRFLEKLPCNSRDLPKSERGAIVVSHSLGGLITRHSVNYRPELFAGVVYAGVPQTCINILGPLRNGDDVMLSSRVLTAQVNFSIRTTFALLPLDGMCFVDLDTKKDYPVDFFNVQDWIKYRFSPCIEPPLPALSTQPSSSIGGIFGSFSTTFPRSMGEVVESLPFVGRKHKMESSNGMSDSSSSRSSPPRSPPPARPHIETAGMEPQMGHHRDDPSTPRPGTSPGTAVTVSRPDALKYLTRTLATVKQFKTELSHIPSLAHSNSYPPFAIIYGKSEPTVFRARVRGRDGIARADAFDNLAFASGDGVVLARTAMLPDGYKAVRGGVVASERGHVTLLGDLEAVGRCLVAAIGARKKGVGFGAYDKKE